MKDILTQTDAAFSRIYPDYRKLVKSLMVGVLATVVQMAGMALLMNITAAFAYVISYHAGMVVSFFFNKTFTFKNTYKKYHYQFLSFLGVAYTQLILNTIVFSLLLSYAFGGTDTVITRMISTAMAAFVGFIYAFLLNKSLTFKAFK